MLETKLKELIVEYTKLSGASGIECMLSDMVEILLEQIKQGETSYNNLTEKDVYLKEQIDNDKAVVTALNNALDELNY